MERVMSHTAEKARVSMNIALSPEDKKFLKVYAAENDTTVAAVIAEFVEKLRKEAQAHG